jgi:hypothetical protein
LLDRGDTLGHLRTIAAQSLLQRLKRGFLLTQVRLNGLPMGEIIRDGTITSSVTECTQRSAYAFKLGDHGGSGTLICVSEYGGSPEGNQGKGQAVAGP